MKKEIALTALLLGLIITAMSTVAFAQTVNVTIGYPSNSNGDLGITTSNSYWIGQFPITVNGGSPGEAYCLTPAGTIYEGSTYTANEVTVPDNSTWEAISYILSWNAPTTSEQAASDQVAIWEILGNNPPYADFTLDSTTIADATALVSAASGMNVAHSGDTLTWISPSTGNTSAVPGETVTFQVQLKNSSGTPRPNVQIDFNATLQPPSGPSITLNSTYVNSMQAFADSNGNAQVSVTVPSDAALGSTIQVQASTQSVWPQEYLDLTNNNPSLQNIIGIGPALCLTVSTSISITGFIMVTPESAIGALSMIAAFAAAFLIYTKLKRPTKKATNL